MNAIRILANVNLKYAFYYIDSIPQFNSLFVNAFDKTSNIQMALNIEIFQAFQIQRCISLKWIVLGFLSFEW